MRIFTLVGVTLLFSCATRSGDGVTAGAETEVSSSVESPSSDTQPGVEPVMGELKIEPAPGIAPVIECATAVYVDEAADEKWVFRGELALLASNAYALDGSWQRHAHSKDRAEKPAEGWSGASNPVDTEDGDLRLTMLPTRLGWAASGTVEYQGISLAISCVQGEPVPLFRYAEGRCVDSEGTEGLNPWPIELVRETTMGECNDFSGVKLGEGLMDYPVLSNWNLRGARLDEADLAFARLIDAQLEGAQLEYITYGYAWISGTVDVHTRAPAEGCLTQGDTINCSQ
jgi:hypothetical protein